MSLSVADQTWPLCASLLLGLILAAGYDAAGAAGSKALRGLLETLLALAALFSLFFLGMLFPLGRLQPVHLLFAALGAALYARTVRHVLAPVFRKAAAAAAPLFALPGRSAKKVWDSCKKLFPKSGKWMAIRNSQ